MFELAKADIAAFVANHSDETFYGFAFDCNSDYGQVLPCLSTSDQLIAAVEGSHLAPEIQAGYDKAKRNIEKALGMKIYDDVSEAKPEERERKYRWSLGDWKYQDFASDTFENSWEPCEDQLSEAAFPDEDDESEKRLVRETRLECVCRVAIRLQSEHAFSALVLTEAFTVFVADHDEAEEESWERLKIVRSQV